MGWGKSLVGEQLAEGWGGKSCDKGVPSTGAILGERDLCPEPGVFCTQPRRSCSRLVCGFKWYRVTPAGQRWSFRLLVSSDSDQHCST